MYHNTDDLRIRTQLPLLSPAVVLHELRPTERATEVVTQARKEAARILSGQDDRLLVIVGPCSVHDPKAAMEYAGRLGQEARKHAADLLVVMRVYFEKPRTTVGWKGLINDPEVDGSFKINDGLRLARRLLADIAKSPFKGVGKPEPLKGDLSGWWSRRITLEHRLVYRVEKGVIYVLQARYHY